MICWPNGRTFDLGEKLVLKMSGHDVRLVDLKILRGSLKVINEAKHYVPSHEEGKNCLDVKLCSISI